MGSPEAKIQGFSVETGDGIRVRGDLGDSVLSVKKK